MSEKVGRKCFNCFSIYGCKIRGGITNDCVTCDIRKVCTVICTGNTTGGVCPACIKVQEILKLLRKENS
jgi:hypothetical protein